MGRGLWRGRGLDLQCCSSHRAGPPSSPHLKHRSQALLSRKPPKREMLKKIHSSTKKYIPPQKKSLRAGRVKTTVSDDYFQSYYLYRTTHVNARLCHTHRCPQSFRVPVFVPFCFHPGQKPEKRQEPLPTGGPTGWISITSTTHSL